MGEFIVERKIVVEKPLQEVFAIVRDFKQWPAWSPWLIQEKDCQLTYKDDGKSYSWEGVFVGSGSMTVKKISPNERIDYHLQILKPWKSESAVSLIFSGKPGATEVTWRMVGKLPFFMFWMKKMLVGMIGMDYARGLAMLKEYVEQGSVSSHLTFIGEQKFGGGNYVGIRRTCLLAQIDTAMQADFEAIAAEKTALGSSEKALSLYHRWDVAKGEVDYTAAVFVDEFPESLPSGFVQGEIAMGPTYQILHTGCYHYLGNAWAAGMSRKQNKVFKARKGAVPFEIYLNDPELVAPGELQTEVHFPS